MIKIRKSRLVGLLFFIVTMQSVSEMRCKGPIHPDIRASFERAGAITLTVSIPSKKYAWIYRDFGSE